MMVCGNVLGKAKTTKVGMVWYEFNIVNQSMNQGGRCRAARAAKKSCRRFCIILKDLLVSRDCSQTLNTYSLRHPTQQSMEGIS